MSYDRTCFSSAELEVLYGNFIKDKRNIAVVVEKPEDYLYSSAKEEGVLEIEQF